jgi:signal transduction histidine kinase
VHTPRIPADPSIEAVEQLLEEGRSSGARALGRREVAAELLVGGAFLLAAAAMAFLLPSDRPLEIGELLVFALAYAAATRIQFDVGAGYSPPTQLVLVPMLFALPAYSVPLVVAAGLLLGDVPDYVMGRRHGSRAVKVLGDSWHAVGPALVLGIAGTGDPAWQDWPVYLAALAAQVGCDLVAATLREWLGRGVAPRVQVGVLAWAYAVDVLLAPVGLLAAFASADQPYAFLLMLPLAGLLVILARERSARLDNVRELGHAYRETAELNARLLDTERRATRAREELLASASHELQTPLAILLGLVDTARGQRLPDTERDRVYSTMRRQTLLMRHLVRQFLDYTWVKAGHQLEVSPRPVDVLPVVEEVAQIQTDAGTIEVEADTDLPDAMVDPDRLHQVLMSLVSNAVKFSPPGSPVVIRVSSGEESITISVSDRGPGIDAGDLPNLFDEGRLEREAPNGGPSTGLGLYLARSITEPQGGRIEVTSVPGEGSCFTIVLRRAEARRRHEGGREHRRRGSGSARRVGADQAARGR